MNFVAHTLYLEPMDTKQKLHRVSTVAAMIGEKTYTTRRLISDGYFGEVDLTPRKGGRGGSDRRVSDEQVQTFKNTYVRIGGARGKWVLRSLVSQ